MQEESAVSTHTQSNHDPDIKITICENRLEFVKVGQVKGATREALHRLLDRWLEDEVRNTRRVSGQTEVL